MNAPGHRHGDVHHAHHGPLAAGNLLGFEALEEQTHVLLGDRYRSLLTELTHIVEYQWRSSVGRGLVKGFLLSGPPGTGKTTLAKRLAFELAVRFREGTNEQPVMLALIDGSEIARSRYGESEERIRDIFAHARSGFTDPGQRTVLLFDDVESILMARGSQHAKEWHFSQDSVFFHASDELDTSRTVVVLTTNRPDLVDDAIRDRFLEYRIGYPEVDVLVEVALGVARRQSFGDAELARLEAQLRAAVASGTVKSMRDAGRFVVQQYVEGITGTPSLAQKST